MDMVITGLRSDRDGDHAEVTGQFEEMSVHIKGMKTEVKGLKRKNEKADSSAPKRKAKEPETPETLEKKKLQKELDAAKRNVTKATAAMEQDREAEDTLKQGCDAGRSAKPALTAAKKKREKSEDKLARAEKELATLEAEFALTYPTAPLAPAV